MAVGLRTVRNHPVPGRAGPLYFKRPENKTKEKLNMKNKLASKLAAAGVIGALYAGLTYLFAFSSFTANQLRVAEALTLMPMLIPQASCGLTVGCFLSNLISGYGVADLIVGPLATLLAGYLTSRCKNYFWGAFWPVAVNAVAIGSMITILSGVFTLPVLLVNMGQIALGQAIACYALGVPLVYALKRSRAFNKKFPSASDALSSNARPSDKN